MSGAVNKIPDARYKLIKTFFWIVRESGMGEDNARAIIERLFKKTSLKLLTTDELKNVVDELVKCTGIELRKPLPKEKIQRKEVAVSQGGKIIELPTRDQLAIIEFHADKMYMSQETLQHLIKKATGGCPTLSLLSARKLIEMLKAMYARGWQDDSAEKPPAIGTRRDN
jgi:hypothetical protein